MNSEITITEQKSKPQISNQKNVKRLKILGVIFTIFGVALFSYFIYSVGFNEILSGITKIGFGGFAFILLLYFLKLAVRAFAWRLSVYEPHKLDFKDTLPAVIIGEALSSIIPLGILISGTAKAVAVRRRVPLVVGLASIATENLFYSLVTGLFICFGAFAFLRQFPLEPTFIYLIDLVIGAIIISIIVRPLRMIAKVTPIPVPTARVSTINSAPASSTPTRNGINLKTIVIKRLIDSRKNAVENCGNKSVQKMPEN